MDDEVPKENVCIFKDVLECSVSYKLSEDYLSEARKEKVIQCSNRRKDSLHETIGSSGIEYQKTATLLVHPMTTLTDVNWDVET